MTVDYRNRVLTMRSRCRPSPRPGVQRLPMRVHRLAMVKGIINRDNPVPFVIDTGGEVISLSRSTAQALRLEPPRHIALKVYGTSGWDPTAFLMPGLHLSFDRVHLENQAVVVLDLDAPSALLGLRTRRHRRPQVPQQVPCDGRPAAQRDAVGVTADALRPTSCRRGCRLIVRIEARKAKARTTESPGLSLVVDCL